MMIVLLLLLLGACGCTGSYTQMSQNYGEYLQLWIPSRTEMILFQCDGKPDTVLWSRSGFQNATNHRGSKSWSYYEIERLTSEDEGTYTAIDKYGSYLEKYHVKVSGSDEESPLVTFMSIAVVPTVIFVCCYCCVSRCCPERSSKKEISDTDQPALQQVEAEREPVSPRPVETSQPTESLHPARPYFSTSPLLHNPIVDAPPAYSEIYNPTVDAPPAYSEVPPAAEPARAPSVPSAHSTPVPASSDPTVLLFSDQEPRFEMNFTSNSPLNSDLAHDTVYTSHNLNFP